MRYDVNVLGTKGPRKMTAIVPAIDADSGRPVGHAPSIHADNGIMDRRAPCTSAVMHRKAAPEMFPLLSAIFMLQFCQSLALHDWRATPIAD